ncbi:MAG: glycoside hydrolase family 27 protein [Candidatus Aminicenantes bacterium]|nr:glycoside hydrolase family 27 protein [Candidatus Aminicenantes bacterium]
MTSVGKSSRLPFISGFASCVLALGTVFLIFTAAQEPAWGHSERALTLVEAKPGKAHSDADGLALTPPMGWYPWNVFGEEPQTEKLIKEIVDALVRSGLKDAGYAYVGPDEGICFSRGPDGKLTSNLTRYPSGLRGLGDYIHKKGLKYALYTDAGSKTCSTAMPGTKGHEFEDMRAFADWRADYIKIDWCNSEGQDIVKTYSLLGEAQRVAGRPVIHSLCSWGEGYPWRWAGAIGHMWRTTADICGPGKADWARAVRIAFANEKLSAFAGPGRWNDPDMMVVGMPGLSEAQNRSLLSLWCMMASPLIAGNDLRDMNRSTIDILTNLEAIAIDQDPLGAQGHVVWNDGNVSLWAGKPLYDGSRAVLVFYQGKYKAQQRIVWDDVGFDAADELYVRDLWTRETSGPHAGGVTVSVGPDDVALLRISKTKDFSVAPILVADTYFVSLRTAGTRPERLTGTVTIVNKGSSDLPPWRVDPRSLPAWLSVAVTGSGKSQSFINTVMTAGLKKGAYHALVRADNVDPISGKPMSALYYDVDLEVVRDVRR